LEGFNRIFLKKGEKRAVSFTLKPEQMTVIDNNGKSVIEAGNLEIAVGGSQPVGTVASGMKTVFTVVK
jgi:beta-glucosidase